MRSWLQLSAISLFFAAIFLNVLVGETVFGIFSLSLVVLSLFFVSKEFSRDAKERRPLTIIDCLWFALVAVATLSLGVTLSIPLTLQTLLLQVSGLLVFATFSRLDIEAIRKIDFFQIIVVLVNIIAMLHLFFLFAPFDFPNVGTIHVVFTRYGHTHAAALYVMALPLSWFLVEKKRSLLNMALFFGILFALLFSFGRWALFIAVLEILVLGLTHQKIKWKKAKYVAFGILAIGVVSFLAINFGLQKTGISCNFPEPFTRICKPFFTDLRSVYWKQAITAFSVRPLLGWGGGTFGLLSSRFQEKPGQFSFHAHNDFLQSFAEYGLIGGGILALMCSVLAFFAMRVIYIGKDRRSACLALAILASMGVSLLDFSWQFKSIWLMFSLLTALFISRESVPKVKNIEKIDSFFQQFRKISLILLVVVGVSSLFANVLFWQKKYITAFFFFPFDPQFAKSAVIESDPSSITFRIITTLYRNHVEVIDSAVFLPNISARQKASLLEQTIKMEPFNWQRKYFYLVALYEAKEWEKFAVAFEDWAKAHDEHKLDILSPEDRRTITRFAIIAANNLLETDSQKALRLYTLIYQIHPWQFSQNKLAIFEQLNRLPIEVVADFVNSIDSSNIWQYRLELRDYYQKVLEDALVTGDFERAKLMTISILKLKQDFSWQTAELLKENIRQNILEKQAVDGSTLRGYEELILVWEDVYTPKQYFDSSIKEAISSRLLQQGNALLLTNTEEAVDYHVRAAKLYPHIFYPESYVRQMPSDATERFAIAKKYVMAMAKRDDQRLLMESIWHLQLFQDLADLALEQGDAALAEQSLMMMSEIFINNYWGAAQIGNYFVMKGDLLRAQAEYQRCIESPNTVEGVVNCVDELRLLREGLLRGNSRYLEGVKRIYSY